MSLTTCPRPSWEKWNREDEGVSVPLLAEVCAPQGPWRTTLVAVVFQPSVLLPFLYPPFSMFLRVKLHTNNSRKDFFQMDMIKHYSVCGDVIAAGSSAPCRNKALKQWRHLHSPQQFYPAATLQWRGEEKREQLLVAVLRYCSAHCACSQHGPCAAFRLGEWPQALASIFMCCSTVTVVRGIEMLLPWSVINFQVHIWM